MISPVGLALVYTVGAGLMNGAFALPTKHIKIWNFENIWLTYSIWAFLILPWLAVFILDPAVLSIYRMMPVNTAFVLVFGGLLFGTGQVCFAQAMNLIGISLGFVLNIGTGTALGTLLPLIILNPKSILTAPGVITLIGIAIIFLGLGLSYSAGKKRDQEKLTNSSKQLTKNRYMLGFILAVLAGVFSSGQNFSFALTSNMHQIASNSGADSLTASIIIWPPFLTCCFIPYALYMLYLHRKNDSFLNYRKQGNINNNFLGLMMAIFWFGSLMIYSKASLLIGSLGPVIVWPLFMVLIILTSNFLAWMHDEWSESSSAIKNRLFSAVGTLVVAVIVIATAAVFT